MLYEWSCLQIIVVAFSFRLLSLIISRRSWRSARRSQEIKINSNFLLTCINLKENCLNFFEETNVRKKNITSINKKFELFGYEKSPFWKKMKKVRRFSANVGHIVLNIFYSVNMLHLDVLFLRLFNLNLKFINPENYLRIKIETLINNGQLCTYSRK